MSLFGMSLAYEAMRFRTRMAEEQMDDFSDLLAKWFLDSDLGARTFLIEIARLRREEVRAKVAPTNTIELESK